MSDVAEIDGAKLLEELVAYYRQYVRVGEDEYVVLATWVLHCHAFPVFTRTPYLNVTSPAPDCGKTQLLEVTELVVPEPINTSSVTAAVLARAIEAYHPVLLLDELDQLMKGNKELLAAILPIINGGYKKSGSRLVNEMRKGNWEMKRLSTFCPKMLSGISQLDPPTRSRCIEIRMERLAPGDRVDDPDEYIIEPQAAKLKSAAASWAKSNLKKLSKARPDSPSQLRNRHREVARPLFAVADAAGGDWGKRIRAAVVYLFSVRDAAPSEDMRILLLADLREVFGERERMSSAEILEGLHAMEEKPWVTWGRNDKPMNASQLARQLRDFKITSRTLRVGMVTFKGYERDWFTRIWRSYLPNVTVSSDGCDGSCDGSKSGFPPSVYAHCDAVTAKKHMEGEKDLLPDESVLF